MGGGDAHELEALLEFGVGDQLEGGEGAALDAVVVGGEARVDFLLDRLERFRTRIPSPRTLPGRASDGGKARLVDGAGRGKELVVADALAAGR